MGDPDKLLRIDPIEDKFASFGWFVKTIDGHDFNQINEAIALCKNKQFPQVIIAETIKGKGSKIMENDPAWHYWQSKKAKDIGLEI